METNTGNWIAEIIALIAVVCGLVGAWIRDRLGLAHRLTKLETRQDHLIEQVSRQNEILMDFLREYRDDHQP